eukprot:TRINITY_DN12683_c0_g1_i1.p2 TRINITY_DN12683_c0_g1~~TRINITY_DN12683_c0_g1_i1.p2  ORF type:complete len:175 (-),score=31.82 TRINITY_DN12683_c0_g1_i1:135-659(-)
MCIRDRRRVHGGFAKALSNQNEQLISVPVGTPLYCSPQVMEGKYYTVKTDIWSIGIIYYEMLYGTTPWPCSGFDDLKQQMALYPYIRYPNHRSISQASFNFLHNALQFEESQRIGWDDVKNHEIFSGLENPKKELINLAEIRKEKDKHKEHKHKKEKKGKKREKGKKGNERYQN